MKQVGGSCVNLLKKGDDRLLYTEALKSARLKANMTQEEVAEILRVSKGVISHWEIGRGSEPSIGRLIQLADIYKVSVDELIGHNK